MIKIAAKLKSLLNGGGEAVGVAGMRREIAHLEGQAADARAELSAMPMKRQELLLADAERDLKKLDDRESELYVTLEKISLAMPKLQTRLIEIEAAAKTSAVNRHRANIAAKATLLEQAVRAAIEANESAKLALQMACAELGEGLARLAIVDVSYPGFLHQGAFDVWKKWIDDALSKQGQWRPPEVPTRVATAPAAMPIWPQLVKVDQVEIIIGRGGYQNGPKEFWKEGHRATVPVGAADRLVRSGVATYGNTTVVSSAAPKSMRVPIIDELHDSDHRLVRVTRAGYTDPNERQCAQGDIVSLPEAIANQVVRNGAGDYYTAGEVSAS